MTTASTLNPTSGQTSPTCTAWRGRCTASHSLPTPVTQPCHLPMWHGLKSRVWRTADTASSRSGCGTSSVPTGGGMHEVGKRVDITHRLPGTSQSAQDMPTKAADQAVTTRMQGCQAQATFLLPPRRCGHGTLGQPTYQTPLRRAAITGHNAGGTAPLGGLTATPANSGRLSGPTCQGTLRMTSHW